MERRSSAIRQVRAMTTTHCFATFFSTHQALRLEKVGKEQNLEIKMVPVPREISSSCGLACRFIYEDEHVIQELCQDQGIELEGIYCKNAQDTFEKTQ